MRLLSLVCYRCRRISAIGVIGSKHQNGYGFRLFVLFRIVFGFSFECRRGMGDEYIPPATPQMEKQLREEKVQEGGKRGRKGWRVRGTLALRCPALTTQPDGPGIGARKALRKGGFKTLVR